MRRWYLQLAVFVVLTVIVFGGCGKPDKEKKDVLAVVDGEVITLPEFNGRIAKMPQHFQALIEKDKKKFLDDLIMQKLLYKEAVKEGYAKRAETKELIEEANKKIIIAALISEKVEGSLTPSEEQLLAYYDENKGQFVMPERWHAAHILVATPEEAVEVRQALDSGADFAKLAKERSKDSTASNGGDVGYFSKGQLVPEFEEACFKLEPGAVSEPVKTQFGYHIIKLIDKQDAGVQEFAKVRNIIGKELERKMKQKRLDEIVAELKGKARITVNEELIKPADEQVKKDEGNS